MKNPMKTGVILAALCGLALLGLLAVGMRHDPRELPSVRVGTLWPDRALPQLLQAGLVDGRRDWRGQARIVNVWASWCGTCREEHPVLLSLAATLRAQGRGGQLIGLNYKDDATEARAWLQRLGDPFATSLVDADGRMGIELGVYGAPETFVVDAQGRIVFRHAGALTAEVVARELLPRLVALAPSPRPSPTRGEGEILSKPLPPRGGGVGERGPWHPADDDRLHALSAELRCLVCQNESLADSTAGLALDLKREMREHILAGESDDEIRRFLVERYGDFVTYRPPWSARTVLLWLGPLLLLLGAAWGAWRHLQRQAQRAAVSAANEEASA
ncbi:hypothetical protein VITFI_CDS3467 (plasmid) [Vitreoscilla filiformis]|uniref:Cytochrome c-type biogenesis protein n=1 Tax=Vitreoscilla filiformis TaxID=63 RepID=A0A221KJQ9_VITFI|nr:hypothetical protein VITFI_CDS3467 [Vitreoscilla filiformis]